MVSHLDVICGQSSSLDTYICVAYIASLVVKEHQRDICNFEIGLFPQIRSNYQQNWESPYDPIIKKIKDAKERHFCISTLILHDIVGNR